MFYLKKAAAYRLLDKNTTMFEEHEWKYKAQK
jgi:hypothetical protein